MALTVNGKRTGAAAHGSDELDELPNRYEQELGENARYWKLGAISAFERLAAIVGGKYMADELAGDWDDGRSWKQICLDTEKLVSQYQTEPSLVELCATCPPEPEKSLNDMTPEEQAKWFANVEEIEIP